MKKAISALLLCFTIVLNANMASPINRGTLSGTPFISKYVRVLHESILITLNDSHDYAKFDIEYSIESEKEGINIPLLFYAFGYDVDFTVSIDGKIIDLNRFTNFWNAASIKENNLTNFQYLYTTDIEEIADVEVSFKEGNIDRLRIEDFIYFETDLSKGKHSIKVSYKANAWTYSHSRLNETGYKYALSPARFWKSFGSLDIVIDASKLSSEIETNLENPTSGSLGTTANYHFSDIPVDVINIDFVPQISGFAKLLLEIEYLLLAILFMLPIVYFHLKTMKTYRKSDSKKLLSIIAILGGVLLPILFIFAMIFSTFFIDFFLGSYASGRAGYGAFFFFYLLPVFWIIYLIFVLIIDYIFKYNYKM